MSSTLTKESNMLSYSELQTILADKSEFLLGHSCQTISKIVCIYRLQRLWMIFLLRLIVITKYLETYKAFTVMVVYQVPDMFLFYL